LCGSFEKLKKLPQPEKQRSNHFVGKGTPTRAARARRTQKVSLVVCSRDSRGTCLGAKQKAATR
jgi:hypothetical protein